MRPWRNCPANVRQVEAKRQARIDRAKTLDRQRAFWRASRTGKVHLFSFAEWSLCNGLRVQDSLDMTGTEEPCGICIRVGAIRMDADVLDVADLFRR